MDNHKPMPFIEITGLTRFFGGLAAVMDLNLDMGKEEIMGLIGPNGAGKSTVLNMIGGTLSPSRGKVTFKGEDITRLPSHRRAKKGISRLYQSNILFNHYTALENVLVGLHLKAKIGLFGVLLKRGMIRRHEQSLCEEAFSILEFAGIPHYADQLAINLPHGTQRLLGLAVALAVEPELILLDEPFTGMTNQEVMAMMDMIRKLKDIQKMTCIVIEHNLRAVMELCDRIAVLNFGVKIAEGTPKEITENPAVMEAYLGAEEDAA